MSDGAERQRLPAEWDRLELATRRLLGEHERLRRGSEAAARRIKDMEDALAGVSSGRLDPLEMTGRLEKLETENRELRERLEAARARVEGLLGRLRFLEEAR
jgi:chromosome segregation ATPase